LDIACGAGRNALWLAERGFAVDAVDISAAALTRAQEAAEDRGLRLNLLEHDLDEPLALSADYQLILVIRYVNLPLLQELVEQLTPGGWLICEQHLVSDVEVIGPTNPAYRVAPGALAAAAQDLDIQWVEEGVVTEPDGRLAALSQLVARRPG
jgi:SAM-dependent methyltransferase